MVLSRRPCTTPTTRPIDISLEIHLSPTGTRRLGSLEQTVLKRELGELLQKFNISDGLVSIEFK